MPLPENSKRVSEYPENTSPAATDWLLSTKTPGGTPETVNVPIANALALLAAAGIEAVVFTEGAAPSTPASGLVALYAKADGLLYSKDDAGVEAAVSGGGGGGGGNTRVKVFKAMPPAADAATIDTRAGGSTPAENYPVWDFDPSAVENMDFLCQLGESYGGGGTTFTIAWSADGVAAGDVVWEIAIRRIADDAEDVDTAHAYVYNQVVSTAPSVDGEVTYAEITFTDGADMDSWAAGEYAIVRVRRLATDAADTMDSNDAELWGITAVES